MFITDDESKLSVSLFPSSSCFQVIPGFSNSLHRGPQWAESGRKSAMKIHSESHDPPRTPSKV